jgi:hypothetical protein
MDFATLGTADFDKKSKLEVAGSTDLVTECQCCGKKNLKGTKVLKDEWGNYSFFGVNCAKNALDIWSKSTTYQKQIDKQLKQKFSVPVADIHTVICGTEYKLTTGVKGMCQDLAFKKVNGEWVQDNNKVAIRIDFQYALDTNRVQQITNVNQVVEWLETFTNFKFPF